jgi:hypothetical protein
MILYNYISNIQIHIRPITLQTVAMLDIKGNSAGTVIGIKFRL